MLHEVSLPPLDLEATADLTFLLEMTVDKGRQASPTDQLVLLDIVILDARQLATAPCIRRIVRFG